MDTVKQELLQYMETIQIIDSHEHLCAEEERTGRDVDFSVMFSHYCTDDLKAAGMTSEELGLFLGNRLSPAEKWTLFSPFYRLIRSGSFARAARISIQKFYGLDELENAGDAEYLSAKIKENNRKGLYDRVIRQACRIERVINYSYTDKDLLVPVMFFDSYIELSRHASIEALEASLRGRGTGRSITSLERYVQSVGDELLHLKNEGCRGVKFASAYMRNLDFADQSRERAEALFDRLFSEAQGVWRHSGLGYEESRPLQNYLMHRVVEMCQDLRLHVVFHTGYQTAGTNKPDNSGAEPLWYLFRRFPSCTFILLHGGFPRARETAMLAKQYPNVYLDMAWMHILSPRISADALRCFTEMVPQNKIFGFGGDYTVPEKIFGHLTIAKENIAGALSGRIHEESMSLGEALSWIDSILYENPKRVFDIR